jgi:hypothetical protein
MEANAALRAIVRRDTGEGYREMLERLARESGIATPTAEDLVRLDRERKGKRLSNEEWASPSDPEARVAKLKDGRTRLAYKPEHAVDLDTGAIVAAEIHSVDRGDTATLPDTLEAAAANLAAVDAAPTAEDPAELVADKGYHSRDGLKGLEGGAWKSRIAERKVRGGVHRWHGDDEARRAVYNNRARLRSDAAKEAFRLRAELCERGFAHVLDRGGMRRAWLRGRESLRKRYLVHVAGYNLGLIMRLLVRAGTPREFLATSLTGHPHRPLGEGPAGHRPRAQDQGRRAGVSRPCVRRWRERFACEVWAWSACCGTGAASPARHIAKLSTRAVQVGLDQHRVGAELRRVPGVGREVEHAALAELPRPGLGLQDPAAGDHLHELLERVAVPPRPRPGRDLHADELGSRAGNAALADAVPRELLQGSVVPVDDGRLHGSRPPDEGWPARALPPATGRSSGFSQALPDRDGV